MLRWLNTSGAIHCPNCDRATEFDSAEMEFDDGPVTGVAICTNCVVPPTFRARDYSRDSGLENYRMPLREPLTFSFSYDILTGRMKTEGQGCTTEYYVSINFGQSVSAPAPAYNQQTTSEYQQQPESSTMNVYVIRRRDARNIIVDVITTQRRADCAYGERSVLEILPYECEHAMDDGVYLTSFKVWLVTVGKGDSTRIVGVFTKKKDAAKIAAPISGRLRELEAVPRKRQLRNISVFKSYVCMTDGNSEYQRAQVIDHISVRRKLYEGEEDVLFPVATFRRRYNSTLPHRIEILSVSERDARDIAVEFGAMDDEEISELLEYNVDYLLVKEENRWRFDPCLLNQPA